MKPKFNVTLRRVTRKPEKGDSDIYVVVDDNGDWNCWTRNVVRGFWESWSKRGVYEIVVTKGKK